MTKMSSGLRPERFAATATRSITRVYLLSTVPLVIVPDPLDTASSVDMIGAQFLRRSASL